MSKVDVIAAAMTALALAGCVTTPAPDPELERELAAEEEARANRPIAVDDGPPRPPVYAGRPAQPVPPPVRVQEARDRRDTPPVDRPRIAVGFKPRYAVDSGFPRFDPALAFARFDDAVAVSEAIGDSPPDFAFRLIGSDAWAWADPSGEMLIVEGDGSNTVQYFFGARDDSPQFIRTGTYGYAFADGRLIGTFHSNGAPVAERVFNNTAGDAQQLLVRGRSLYHAAEDRRWDRDTAQRWTSVQPAYGSWVTTWIAPPIWSGDYGRYRDRPESRERRERRRLTREQRRERAERFTRWRNGGGNGAPPGPTDGAGTGGGGAGSGSVTPPRTPGQPGGPVRPPRPPRPPLDPGAVTPPPADPVPPAPVDPARVTPPPAEPAPPVRQPAAPPRRDVPGWQGYATDQPQQPELVETRDEPQADEAAAATARREEAAEIARRRAAADAAAREAQERAYRDAQRRNEAEAAARDAALAADAEQQRRAAAELAAMQERAARDEAAARQREAQEQAARQREEQEQAARQREAEAQQAAAQRAANAAAARAAAEREAAERAAAAAAAEAEANRRDEARLRPVDNGTEAQPQ